MYHKHSFKTPFTAITGSERSFKKVYHKHFFKTPFTAITGSERSFFFWILYDKNVILERLSIGRESWRQVRNVLRLAKTELKTIKFCTIFAKINKTTVVVVSLATAHGSTTFTTFTSAWVNGSASGTCNTIIDYWKTYH